MRIAFSFPKDNNKFETYKTMFIDLVTRKFPELTVNGLEADTFNPSESIHLITVNGVVVIDSDNRYDVDFYPTIERAKRAEKIETILDFEKNYADIVQFLNIYYKNKQRNVFQSINGIYKDCGYNQCNNCLYDYNSIRIYPAYTRVGSTVIPAVNDNQVCTCSNCAAIRSASRYQKQTSVVFEELLDMGTYYVRNRYHVNVK